MSKSAPIKKKTSGHKIGDKVKCIMASSPWHKVGRVSKVVQHPRTGLASVEALDGFFDELSMCSSKFESVN